MFSGLLPTSPWLWSSQCACSCTQRAAVRRPLAHGHFPRWPQMDGRLGGSSLLRHVGGGKNLVQDTCAIILTQEKEEPKGRRDESPDSLESDIRARIVSSVREPRAGGWPGSSHLRTRSHPGAHRGTGDRLLQNKPPGLTHPLYCYVAVAVV